MKTIYLFLFFTAIINNSYGQSNDFKNAVNAVTEVGLFGYRGKGDLILEKMERLSSKELIYLIEGGESLEKVYAYWAYAKRENSDYRPYFFELVSDTCKIEVEQGGCLYQSPREVGSFIFDISENFQERYGTFKTYPHFLDSMALEVFPHMGIWGNINCRIMNFAAPKNLYHKIRKKAENGSGAAARGLASYQNVQDIPIIKKYLSIDALSLLNGLACVEKFPNSAFEKDVLAIFYAKMNQKHPLIFGTVCRVLREYESPEVTRAFNELFNNPNK